jgi:citrate synthase
MTNRIGKEAWMSGLHSQMGHSTADRIVVRGHDLCESLLGKINLGEMAFLELTGRLPNAQEAQMFNAVLVTLVEHGMTPSALAARLTYMGAPEALQGAVAAGLLGVGSVFMGTAEGCARFLQEALGPRDAATPPAPLEAAGAEEMAQRIVTLYRSERRIIPGLGHPIHKPVDPRAVKLFALAQEQGFHGPYVTLLKAVHQEAERVFQKNLPINATGAIGAVVSELGLPWQIARGIGIIARAVGLVGHIWEEINQPIGREVIMRVELELMSQRQQSGQEP